MSTLFFFSINNKVFLADDLGHCNEQIKLQENIITLLFCNELSVLLIVTKSLNLSQYKLTETSSLMRINHMKLALHFNMKNEESTHFLLKSISWISLGLLCFPSEEKYIKIYDLLKEENYIINLNHFLGNIIERDDRIKLLSYNSKTRYLSVGTERGLIVILRYNGPIRYYNPQVHGQFGGMEHSKHPPSSSNYFNNTSFGQFGQITNQNSNYNQHNSSSSNNSSSSTSKGTSDYESSTVNDWEFVYMYKTSYIDELNWYTSSNSLCVVTELNTFFLSEAFLYSESNKKLSVLQVNKENSIELLINSPYFFSGSSPSNYISCSEPISMKMKGLFLYNNCFIIWDGKLSKVYKINLETYKLEFFKEFYTNSLAMCLCDSSYVKEETIFVCDSQLIKLYNFNGVQKNSIQFSESEGSPKLIDINKKFLVCSTSVGIIKVYDPDLKLKELASTNFYNLINQKYNFNVKNPSSSSSSLSFTSSSNTSTFSYTKDNLRIKKIKINCSGTMVAILCDIINGNNYNNYFPDTKLYVYDRLKGILFDYNFFNVSKYPYNFYWDDLDERLLSVETHKMKEKNYISYFSAINTMTNSSTSSSNFSNRTSGPGSSGAGYTAGSSFTSVTSSTNTSSNIGSTSTPSANLEENVKNSEVFLLFVTSENGIFMQDSIPLEQSDGPLIYFSVPELFFRSNVVNKTIGSTRSIVVKNSDALKNEDESKDGKQDNNTGRNLVSIKIMRDFLGISNIRSLTDTIKFSLLDFNYYLALGKLDEAYKVIKDINSVNIWENMAQMCVKTRRLDVAEVCLGNMGNARGASAIRNFKNSLLRSYCNCDFKKTNKKFIELNGKILGCTCFSDDSDDKNNNNKDSKDSKDEKDNQLVPKGSKSLLLNSINNITIGVLAIQLGLLDDAVLIFKEEQRYDLLNKLYQSSGLWKKSINVAENFDRIHLKQTHYNYAKYLESQKNITEAIKHYELSSNFSVEIPRMLFQMNQMDLLNNYIINSFNNTSEDGLTSDNKTLLKWWASYLESINKIEKAKKYYLKSKDFINLIRIYCYQSDLVNVLHLINETEDRASAYHYARYLENLYIRVTDKENGSKKRIKRRNDEDRRKNKYDEETKDENESYEFNPYLLEEYFNMEYNPNDDKTNPSSGSKLAENIATEFTFDNSLTMEVIINYYKQNNYLNIISEAIKYYSLSGCYNHSIRLSKQFNFNNELMRYALKSTPGLMIECANYFEKKNELDKAIQLYYHGNDIMKALDLCFFIGNEQKELQEEYIAKKLPLKNLPQHKFSAIAYDMINQIVQSLGSNSSPQILTRCGDFLVQNKQYKKAIELFVLLNKYHYAINLCNEYKIQLDDEIIEMLTPPQVNPSESTNSNTPTNIISSDNAPIDAAERKEILYHLAKLLKKNGYYLQASQKYTQAGHRIKSMKCLLRHGNVKLLIQFATISRNSFIYLLAGNYLQQTLQWKEDISIMKSIVLFYTKAKSWLALAGFYEACSIVELDEFNDYKKSTHALKESLKYLLKSKDLYNKNPSYYDKKLIESSRNKNDNSRDGRDNRDDNYEKENYVEEINIVNVNNMIDMINKKIFLIQKYKKINYYYDKIKLHYKKKGGSNSNFGGSPPRNSSSSSNDFLSLLSESSFDSYSDDETVQEKVIVDNENDIEEIYKYKIMPIYQELEDEPLVEDAIKIVDVYKILLEINYILRNYNETYKFLIMIKKKLLNNFNNFINPKLLSNILSYNNKTEKEFERDCRDKNDMINDDRDERDHYDNRNNRREESKEVDDEIEDEYDSRNKKQSSNKNKHEEEEEIDEEIDEEIEEEDEEEDNRRGGGSQRRGYSNYYRK